MFHFCTSETLVENGLKTNMYIANSIKSQVYDHLDNILSKIPGDFSKGFTAQYLW